MQSLSFGLVAVSFVGLAHGLVLRSLDTKKSTSHMPTCMDLDFSTLASSEGESGFLSMKFIEVLPGIDATVTSDDYQPEKWENTGLVGDNVVKINMSPGHTTYYDVTFRDKSGTPVVPPCFQFSILDIDCAKNGCQKLTIDMCQFVDYSIHVHSDTELTAKQDECIAEFYKEGEERSPNPDGVPLEEDEAKNAVEFVVAGVAEFRYMYEPIDGTKGSSTYLTGHSGVGPKPVEPTEKCPYGSVMETMEAFLPTETYKDSPHCPAGKVINVCSNPDQYGIFSGYSHQVSDKLENSGIFGPSGTIKYAVKTKSILASQISVQKLLDEDCDLFWIGANLYDSANSPLVDGTSALTQAQIKEIVHWASMATEHVVIAFQMYPTMFGDYGPNSEHAVNPMIATELGESFVKKGPFGDASTFNQAGSWHGRLTTLDEDACVLVRDSRTEPDAIMVLDTEYNSVLVSDNGIFTSLSGAMSTGSAINHGNANDRLFGNFISFMMGLICQGPPADCSFNEDPFERCLAAPTVIR